MNKNPTRVFDTVPGLHRAARERQRRRFAGTKLVSNAVMTPAEAREFCRIDEGGPSACPERRRRGLLHMVMKQFQLSARAFHRILKVSRTIADLAGVDLITTAQMAEALQYRSRGLGL